MAKQQTKSSTEKELSPEEFNKAKMLEVEAKIVELKEKHKCEIHPIVFKSPETKKIIAVGYLKEPSLQAEMAYMDLATRMPFSAGETILEACIIKEESDPRLYTAENANKEFYKGAVKEAGDMVQMYQNQFKKK